MTALRTEQTTILLIRRISPQSRLVNNQLSSITTAIEVEDGLLGSTVDADDAVLNQHLVHQVLLLVGKDQLVGQTGNRYVLDDNAVDDVCTLLVQLSILGNRCHLDERSSQSAGVNRSTVTVDGHVAGSSDRGAGGIGTTLGQINRDVADVLALSSSSQDCSDVCTALGRNGDVFSRNSLLNGDRPELYFIIVTTDCTHDVVSLTLFWCGYFQAELIVANSNSITLGNVHVLLFINRVINTPQGNNHVDILFLDISQVSSLIAHLDGIAILHHQGIIRNSLKQILVNAHLTSPIGGNGLTDFRGCGLLASIIENQA